MNVGDTNLDGDALLANVNPFLRLIKRCGAGPPPAGFGGTRPAASVPARPNPATVVPIGDSRCAVRAARVRERLFMKHAASRELYAYWEERRGTRPAPERSEIEPGAIRGVLSDAFILAVDPDAGHPVRLAGTRVCALFGHELKGESFLNLWGAGSRSIIGSLLAILADECTGTVAGVTAQSAAGDPIDLELLLLPLGTRRPAFARTIGVLAPLKVPPWLGASPVGKLTLGGRRHIGAALEKRLLPRFMSPRRRGLVVYEGGRGRAARPAGEDGPSAA